MTTTIYARQVPPEYQESPLFWDDNLDGVEIYGNRHYNGITSALFDRLPGILDDLADAWDDFTDGTPPAWYDSWAEALADIAPPEGRPEYTRQERKKDWPELLARNYNEYNRPEYLAAALSLITGQEWDSCTLRGCCQGDWQNCIFRRDLWDAASLERLEAEYFNTGTEWIVHDEETPPEDAEEINGFSVYCTEWSDDGIKREIADAAGGAPEAVKLFKFSNYRKIAEYEEA